MILVLPLGHEVELRRLPRATIGLIAVNAIVFLLTHFLITGEFERLQKRQVELVTRGVQLVSQSETSEGDPFGFLFALPEFREKGQTPEEALDFISSRLGREPEKYSRWLEDYRVFREDCRDILVRKIGFVPADFPAIGFFTHMFLHGGWLHIIFNMWFLYLAGCSLEDRWGRFNFIGFYLLGGCAAAFLQYLLYPHSEIPMVGASGAVAAAMGAFGVRYAREKVDCLLIAFIFVRPVVRRFSSPAWAILLLWFGVQLFYASMNIGLGEEGGVAFWAHIGGFLFGAGFASLLKYGRVEKKILAPQLGDPPPDEEDFYQDPNLILAMDLMEHEHYEEGLEKIEFALRRDPRNTDALRVKARLLFLDGSRGESRDLFQDLLYQTKTRKDLFYQIFTEYCELFGKCDLPDDLSFTGGRLCFERGEAGIAARAFLAVQSRDPDSEIAARALFYLGRIQAELENRPQEARETFREFLERFPDHAWAGQARDFLAKNTS